MFAKILIKGKIELITGMHIGTGGEFAAIGAVDSPVIRDTITNLPIIPGSSLKGKLRSMLARQYSPKAEKADNDDEKIKRLFGSADKSSKKNPASRLIFSDMHISNMDELKDKNIILPTETKFENTINRLSGVANPRQIERTIRGCEYNMEIVYNLFDEDEAKEDIALLSEAMQLLKYDYIGGHGSRGYGKIAFKDITAQAVVGNVDPALMDSINADLKEVI
ncbi:MAG: type III-A CRISPR-associated RAMP protein Csm3 [Firmicutes bacterium]|nr:type III-A CRISPR-associated RAMP protein Csm3 [Bacillota bacterium]